MESLRGLRAEGYLIGGLWNAPGKERRFDVASEPVGRDPGCEELAHAESAVAASQRDLGDGRVTGEVAKVRRPGLEGSGEDRVPVPAVQGRCDEEMTQARGH